MTLLPDPVRFETKAELQEQATNWIARHLQDALNRRRSAVFIGSGGGTPGPVYEKLSGLELDWPSITVGLADERWVDEDHPSSNAALLKRTLLQDKAVDAPFLPMKTAEADPFDAIDSLANDYLDAYLADVILLGMGPDAHTLSWFPEAEGLETALDADNPLPVAAIRAIKSDATGDNLERMTLTLPCIAEARSILLLLTGETKLNVYLNADENAPITKMVKAAGGALTVFYCP